MRLRLNNVYLVFGLFQGLVALSLILRAVIALFGHMTPFDDENPVRKDTTS